MSRTTLRRVVSVAAATTLLAGGLFATATTASAQSSILGDFGSSASVPDIPASATVKVDNLSITKSIVGVNSIAIDGEVTYRTTISASDGPDRLIKRLVDLNPIGLLYVEGSAKVTAWQDGQMVTSSVDAAASVDVGTVVSNAAGWLVSAIGNKSVTFEVTYSVKDLNFTPGVFDSGLALEVDGMAELEWPEMGVKLNLVGSGNSIFSS
ncbi:hypothetical protein [Rhodococcus gannanensis]|uniref:Uncharacterized protein n=1 Tax=Rhodococcus gannanensis TaxID=1960308 RepID=A0ABW4P3W2_9NOCA